MILSPFGKCRGFISKSQHAYLNVDQWIRLCKVVPEAEKAMRIPNNWAASCGLNINTSKTELVLFTRKHTLANLILPKLDCVSICLSSETIYLVVILDAKLKWETNAQLRIQKSLNALSTFGKTWGLTPSVIRPILILEPCSKTEKVWSGKSYGHGCTYEL
uniref:Reverse transcriptase domain-containing protein n=1 Tax=Megaselia scalaris TaxID=36166 RepID=T1GMS2_MEGSC